MLTNESLITWYRGAISPFSVKEIDAHSSRPFPFIYLTWFYFGLIHKLKPYKKKFIYTYVINVFLMTHDNILLIWLPIIIVPAFIWLLFHNTIHRHVTYSRPKKNQSSHLFCQIIPNVCWVYTHFAKLMDSTPNSKQHCNVFRKVNTA